MPELPRDEIINDKKSVSKTNKEKGKENQSQLSDTNKKENKKRHRFDVLMAENFDSTE